MTKHIEKAEVQEILTNGKKLESFAILNNLSIEVARQVLNRLLSHPKMSEEAKNYVFSSKTSDDLKGYVCGQDDGYQKGHDAGFAKGVATATLGAIALAGAAIVAIARMDA